MIRLSQFTAAITSTLALACGGSPAQPADEQLNIGETQTLGESLSDYVATWQGYAEAYDFGQGQGDTVLLEVNGDGEGYLRVGDLEAPLVLPATDPLAYYPSPDGFSHFSSAIPTGYELAFDNAAVASNRLQLTARVRPMDSWCALQTPYSQEPKASGYACLPNTATRQEGDVCYAVLDDGSQMPINCVLMWGCIVDNQCSCDEAGCIGAGQPEAKIDAVLEDDGRTLTGTMVADERITIRLTRVD